ncbi:hypothetical protein EfmAA94_05370 [Enterococcus faecium]|nr:hypothetical protein EfmAA94_05370 [Enterococcus faecium]
MYRWQWRQYIIKQSKKERSEIYPEVFTNFTGRALVKGDAGSGKTTFLHSIFLNQSQNYINSKSKVIPVLLSGKLWHRSFHSVLEGILKELKVFVPNITIEIVTSMVFSGEILLLIDGIDECKQNRDLLIHEFPNSVLSIYRIFLQSGLIFETAEGCEFQTEMLDENRIIKISSDVLKRSTSIEMHRLPKSMKKCFLFLLKSFLTQHLL